MTVETRYFRSDTQTINGLLGYKLEITDTTAYAMKSKAGAGQLGIRVWKRGSAGTETEITSGSLVALINLDTVITEVDGTWNCPLTPLNPTDSIVVRVYTVLNEDSSQYLLATFTTGQLNAQSLDASAWTVHYWGKTTILAVTTFYFGKDTTYNSRITNFTYTPYTPVTTKEVHGDGLTFWD